jgi:hypothetical protein
LDINNPAQISTLSSVNVSMLTRTGEELEITAQATRQLMGGPCTGILLLTHLTGHVYRNNPTLFVTDRTGTQKGSHHVIANPGFGKMQSVRIRTQKVNCNIHWPMTSKSNSTEYLEID